ncbi:predicted protein [Streptomyces viridochromogenes DSM 40736]|uniref:Predicted protein n=1 Tax=Streptomyces viridochromogenes (strain DSM 40736 / JCM 4977 / BCRC 1201 / Tue 494) TaxID=591159 RepID=D9X8U1_STRVT|nr:predicted protein [Streptomyces viridochromogenes DSM 40736]
MIFSHGGLCNVGRDQAPSLRTGVDSKERRRGQTLTSQHVRRRGRPGKPEGMNAGRTPSAAAIDLPDCPKSAGRRRGEGWRSGALRSVTEPVTGSTAR